MTSISVNKVLYHCQRCRRFMTSQKFNTCLKCGETGTEDYPVCITNGKVMHIMVDTEGKVLIWESDGTGSEPIPGKGLASA